MRWLSIDPLEAAYVGWSGYVFAKKKHPISAIDEDGKRFFFVGGAGNGQDGWNYIVRFKKIWTEKGIKGFTRVNASGGQNSDVLLVSKIVKTMHFSAFRFSF